LIVGFNSAYLNYAWM